MSDLQLPVTVVVVTFNSAPLLPALIDSLELGCANVPWSLVVADNGSIDRSVDVVRKLAPRAKAIELGRNAGYAAAINAAVSVAEPSIAYLILNPDVRLTAGCLSELLRALDRPGTGIAVPRLLDARSQLIPSMRREPTLLRAFGDALVGATRAGRYPVIGEVVTDASLYESEAITDWAEGSTQLISAECWSGCGPWDERYFLYSEETEFDLRARDRGFDTRYVPTACAIHLEGGSARSPKLWALVTLNRVRLYSRRNGRSRAVFFWMACALREVTRTLMGSPTSREALKALVSTKRLRETPGPNSVH